MATANQIAYWKMRSDREHYERMDTETARSNRAKEYETNRSNVARESEENRKNSLNFLIGAGQLQETQRSNLARENETQRSNMAKELETNRHNLRTEGLERSKLHETIKHNLAQEDIESDKTDAKLWSGIPIVGPIIGVTHKTLEDEWSDPRRPKSKSHSSDGRTVGGGTF